ncbi:MAG: ribonuclease HI family protein [bacterium]|nr:ribonuclease HI family protein [bacterium]
MKYFLYTDGGARGNPGPAGIGIVIDVADAKGERKMVVEYGEYIGEATNNVAEYRALLSGLEKLKSLGATEVVCYLDSELVARQMRREYKVKNKDLGVLFVKAWNVAVGFKKITFTEIPREQNKRADRQVNKAIDSAE